MMDRVRKSLTRIDVAFATVAALLLIANMYFVVLLGDKGTRAQELLRSVYSMIAEADACSEALKHARGREVVLDRTEDGDYYILNRD